MKPPKLLLLLWYCFTSLTTFAQTPKSIEADLLKSFKRISYWDQQDGDVKYDSLIAANKTFGTKLKRYTEKHPFTINYPFTTLKKEKLKIATSANGLFRIYSWNTELGGTMYSFSNVMQYKVGSKTYSKLFESGENGFMPYYDALCSIQNNGKVYYIGVFWGTESSRYHYEGIKMFTIDNSVLKELKIIKTAKGLNSTISYDYDTTFFRDYKSIPKIVFDGDKGQISLPVVAENGKMTNKYTTYKFTGKYFEKVK
ncbi:hypothetical protein GCM10023149_47760 [Mucilaginibacter gynuensis]|uniref:Uncharacterized protein n=1 Tax=Mucilaginibacter gynuensis TaxID=1302236 RepID=A0ABP8HEE9_9SPHI